MPDNGIFCVLLVFWNALRVSEWEGEGEGKAKSAQNQFARNIFHDFLFYMLICLYICTLSTHRSLPIALQASKQASEQYAKGKEAFCIFTYIGVIAFHVLKRSRLSIMHVRKRERESTQRMPRHVDFTNVMQMQCNRFNRLCACWCLHFSRLQFFTCNASSFIY